MSTDPIHVTARLTARSFSFGQLVGWELVVANRGGGSVIVPDPLSGEDDSLTLTLRTPGGKTEVVRLGDIAGEPGVLEGPERRRLPPNGKVVFAADLITYFPRVGPGAHTLQIEYRLQGGRVWRSPEMPFDLLPGAATFLDVTPNEQSGFGWSGVVWVEHGSRGARAMLFDDDGRASAVHGAAQLAAIPDGAEPALSSAPVNWPSTRRWVAWLSGRELHLQFHGDDEPDLDLPAQVATLPADAREPRLVRPLLAENVGDGRPRCTIPVLAKSAAGAQALHLLEADAKGRVVPRHVIPIAGVAAGCWATAPTRKSRVFTFAVAADGEVELHGVELPWLPRDSHGHATPQPARWHALAADALLLGDLRSALDGRVWAGLVVRRDRAWERVVILAPTGGRKTAEVLHRSSFAPPEGAEPVRARVDGAGELHLLYRRGKELAYVPPKEQKPAFTSDRLGQLAPATAHLVLGMEGRRVIVAYDAERGPFWKVL